MKGSPPTALILLLLLLLLLLLPPLDGAGGLLPTTITTATGAGPPANCLEAKDRCLADATCNVTYRRLEACTPARTRGPSPEPETQAACLEAALQLRGSALAGCKCQWRMRRLLLCLQAYWAAHPLVSHGDRDPGVSPFEDPVPEETWTVVDRSKLEQLEAVPEASWGPMDPCLKLTSLCTLNPKCTRLRSLYGAACAEGRGPGGGCAPHHCRPALRGFFERAAEPYTRALLLCPCGPGDRRCGERRRNTIVPSCSYQPGDPDNCLALWDACLDDLLCRSRLANFLTHCGSGAPADGCPRQKPPGSCLRAYMGMIGTVMTPNYVSNSSAQVALHCTCQGSGNQQEECQQLEATFSKNPCLRAAMEAQMLVHWRLLPDSSASDFPEPGAAGASFSVITHQGVPGSGAQRPKPWGALPFPLLLPLLVLGTP
ncbi:GDNF family receptor alpha-3 [Ornithorhynchus anatinus]|uniref:GDNF family receptor alpha-3 n=1 Tax=Ornithorhynchus anatinus TaxID=9258 RepID=UPI0010A8AC0C|nr:GDNF family receptor alpha-3 [Ornithorhynchus anatinus]